MVKIKCRTCKKVFSLNNTRAKSAKYCSKKCFFERNGKRVNKNCLVCGKLFSIKPNDEKLKRGKYCSRKCADKGRHKQLIKVCLSCKRRFIVTPHLRHRKYCSYECYWKCKKVIRKCKICGKRMEVYASALKNNAVKYCSMRCRNKGMRKKRITKKCMQCGKSFKVLAARVKLYNIGKYCSRKCYEKSLKKRIFSKEWRKRISKTQSERYKDKTIHPSWLGGKSFEPYGLTFNLELRNKIRQRDHNACQECGIRQNKLKRRLTCHHIDYCKQNNLPSNLITLCETCHAKTNYKRSYWEKHFQAIRRHIK